jgi:hypothetical protein
MTEDEIIEMAKQFWPIDPEMTGVESLVAFAKLVEDFATAKEREGLVRIIEANIADERAACAKVCDARYMGDNSREDMETKRCAKAIRARTGDKK